MKVANLLLESFGESQKACVTNSSRPPQNFKGKGNPDLPLVCSNYWPPIAALSLCFNHLVFSTFRQCRSAIPQRSAKPIYSIHHTVQYPQRKLPSIEIHDKRTNFQFNLIMHMIFFLTNVVGTTAGLLQNNSCKIAHFYQIKHRLALTLNNKQLLNNKQ